MAFIPWKLRKRLSVRETSLSNRALYTILSNKSAKGKKDTIMAIIVGIKANDVVYLIKTALKQSNLVEEITLDLAINRGSLLRNVFLAPFKKQIVSMYKNLHKKVCNESGSKQTGSYWLRKWCYWIIQGNKTKYEITVLSNDDTTKQLLARSRYILYKTNQIGLKTKTKELNSWLNYIAILKKRMVLLK